jgi:hypothetical protein
MKADRYTLSYMILMRIISPTSTIILSGHFSVKRLIMRRMVQVHWIWFAKPPLPTPETSQGRAVYRVLHLGRLAV